VLATRLAGEGRDGFADLGRLRCFAVNLANLGVASGATSQNWTLRRQLNEPDNDKDVATDHGLWAL
jgi:hypothetical protein